MPKDKGYDTKNEKPFHVKLKEAREKMARAGASPAKIEELMGRKKKNKK